MSATGAVGQLPARGLAEIEQAYDDVVRTVADLADQVGGMLRAGRSPAEAWALGKVLFERDHNLETVQAQVVAEWLMGAVTHLVARSAG